MGKIEEMRLAREAARAATTGGPELKGLLKPTQTEVTTMMGWGILQPFVGTVINENGTTFYIWRGGFSPETKEAPVMLTNSDPNRHTEWAIGAFKQRDVAALGEPEVYLSAAEHLLTPDKTKTNDDVFGRAVGQLALWVPPNYGHLVEPV